MQFETGLFLKEAKGQLIFYRSVAALSQSYERLH